jgi:hypothetical protein
MEWSMTTQTATNSAVAEVEITPEMIEAGVRAFCGYDARFEGPADIVTEIFDAMRRASFPCPEFAGNAVFLLCESVDQANQENLRDGGVLVAGREGAGFIHWLSYQRQGVKSAA